jgi:hypothetical protein
MIAHFYTNSVLPRSKIFKYFTNDKKYQVSNKMVTSWLHPAAAKQN